MLSLAQAVDRRGSAGEPLPTVYQTLSHAGAFICKAQVTLIVGPPSAGKSLLGMNLLAHMGLPSLAFLLDGDELTAAARFASIVTGELFLTVRDDIDAYRPQLAAKMSHVQACFYAQTKDDLELQLAAYEQRYGMPPEVVVLDNAGNLSSAFENEWAVLKALLLELDQLARREQCAVIVMHHMTDVETTEPMPRSKILGKCSQYPRLILSVAFNSFTGEFKVAVVKNTSGPSDPKAQRPLTLYAEPARMRLSEYPRLHESPSLAELGD